MITIEQALEALEQRGGEVGNIQVHPDGYVHGRLSNEVDPGRSYTLIVHPIVKEGVLRVCVLPIARVRRDSYVYHSLAKANAALRCGCVGATSDGEVTYQINHVWVSGSDTVAAQELLERLLTEAIEAVRFLEKTILFGQMVDAGIPKNRAAGIMQTLFPESDENQVTGNETL